MPYYRKKVLDSDKKIISGKYEPAALQFFIGDQLFYRNPCFVKAVCSDVFLIGITDRQNIDRFQMIRQPELPADYIRPEMADPDRTWCIVSLISVKTPLNRFSAARRLNEAMRWHR